MTKMGCKIKPNIINCVNDLAIATSRVFLSPDPRFFPKNAINSNGVADATISGVDTWTKLGSLLSTTLDMVYDTCSSMISSGPVIVQYSGG